jgi:hypothetical protein
MAIQVKCGSCGVTFSVDEKYVGKTGKCAKCGNRIPIVAPSSPEEEDAGKSSGVSAELPPLPQKPKRSPRLATEKQRAFAEDLGIRFDETISSREISTLIDAAITRQDGIASGELLIESHLKTLNESQPSDMVEAMRKRGMCAFMFHWDPDEAAASAHDVGGKFSVTISFSDNLTEKQVHKMTIQHAMELAVKHRVASLTDLFHIYLDTKTEC